jgi:hypothetical protein
LHKSEYLALGADGKTTAFFHSKDEAFWLYYRNKVVNGLPRLPGQSETRAAEGLPGWGNQGGQLRPTVIAGVLPLELPAASAGG